MHCHEVVVLLSVFPYSFRMLPQFFSSRTAWEQLFRRDRISALFYAPRIQQCPPPRAGSGPFGLLRSVLQAPFFVAEAVSIMFTLCFKTTLYAKTILSTERVPSSVNSVVPFRGRFFFVSGIEHGWLSGAMRLAGNVSARVHLLGRG